MRNYTAKTILSKKVLFLHFFAEPLAIVLLLCSARLLLLHYLPAAKSIQKPTFNV
jgi:hypothetical protein